MHSRTHTRSQAPFLTMIGLVAILDPPREDAIRACGIAKKAGVCESVYGNEKERERWRDCAVLATDYGLMLSCCAHFFRHCGQDDHG
jgi:hypothetical protein